MTEPAKDFWARADRDLLARWPKDTSGAPEPAAKLDIQWELDSQADITVSFLESCGIPAFQNGSLARCWGDSPPRAWRSGSPPPGWRMPRRCWTLPRKRHHRSRTDGPVSVLKLHNRRYLAHGLYEGI